MIRLALFYISIILVFLTIISLAEIPKLINYQGMLTDDMGNPLNGNYNLTFKIYSQSSGGTALWTETQNNVSVENGLFNVILGGTNPISSTMFDDTLRYFAITMGTDPELSPRIRLTSVGYAYRALVADSAIVTAAGGAGGWVDDGSVVRLQNSADAVGMGTVNPAARLHIHGSSPADANNGQLLISESTSGANRSLILGRTTSYGFVQTHNHQPLALNPIANYVCIGTTIPNSNLHVNGSVALAYKSVYNNYTITDSDCIIKAIFSAAHSIYLPTALSRDGRVYTIKNGGGANVGIVPAPDQEIDNHYGITLEAWEYVTIMSDGIDWIIIGGNF